MEGDKALIGNGDQDPLGSGGLALPTRQASVVVLDENDQSASGNGQVIRRQDSLEGTQNFYQVGPSSPTPNHRSLNRPQSSSSRQNRNRSVSNANSQFSLGSNNRSNTPGTNNNLPTSPPRSSIPLPTPKGFLSPNKPNSAIRLEKRHASATALVPKRSSLPTKYEYEPSVPLRLTHRSSQHKFDDRTQTSSPGPEVDPLGTHVQSTSLGTALAHMRGTEALEGRQAPSSFHQSGWDRSLKYSVTEASTPPRTLLSELSSDELVHDTHRNQFAKQVEKSNGHTVIDIDKGYSQAGQKRKYQSFQNPLTTFFFSGRLMTGGDSPWSMILITVLLFGISGVWLGTTGAWMWVHGTEYGLAKGAGVAITIIFCYLFCLVVSSLIASAFRDPGIIPRNLDLDPPLQDIDNEWCEAWPRELTVNGAKVTVKYCETCQSYRPPRSSHCRLCGNCVDGIDHHCSYLHTCVGKRNYFSFLVLLVSAAFSDIYIVVFSALHFSLICNHENVSFGRALSESPGAAVSFLLGLMSLGPVMFLLWYHCRLLLYNITTVEQIRASASTNLLFTRGRPENPFGNRSIVKNIILASIARPQFPSWIDASGYERVDGRRVNPALVDPKWRAG